MANAIKWLGIETSYLKVLRFCQGVRAYRSKVGMFPFQMVYMLKTLHIKYKKYSSYSLKDMDRDLEAYKSIILIYDTVKQGSHAIFIDAFEIDGYRTWNKTSGAEPYCSRKDMEDALTRSSKHKGHLHVYVIEKEEKDAN